MSVPAANLMVFREGRRDASARLLQSRLAESLLLLRDTPRQDESLALLLLAGELECGVADATATKSSAFDPELVKLQAVTDAVADFLIAGDVDVPGLSEALQSIRVPEAIKVSAPEGFAYYALHPFAYADAVTSLAQLGDEVAVIGIRSIGTTLSALVAAALSRQGKKASRITVRPHGHPYDRELRFSPSQLEYVLRAQADAANVLVVDEGPGLSGSSFLAVAEALVSAGVPQEKITIICGHEPNFDSLRANHASQRARQFRWLAVNSTPRLPEGTGDFLGGGAWRSHFLPRQSTWPAVWTWFERIKYRSSDRRSASANGGERLYKFFGFGHYGHAVLKRERTVADAGFGPHPRPESNGFVSSPFIQGRAMCCDDLNDDDLNDHVLNRMADYCAFRAATFVVETPNLSSLQQMADHNLRQLGLCEPGLALRLDLNRPVIADGRMQPHEWLLSDAGEILKTDSGAHGDDHFFPGPTDIAWDLAGAIVEWEMNGKQSSTFLELYRQKSGDDAVPRIDSFLLAYSAFRIAYCLMAANALGEGDESQRFCQASEKYKLAIPVRSSAAATAIA